MRRLRLRRQAQATSDGPGEACSWAVPTVAPAYQTRHRQCARPAPRAPVGRARAAALAHVRLVFVAELLDDDSTGAAAASPNGQSVLPAMLLATLTSRSMSRHLAFAALDLCRAS